MVAACIPTFKPLWKPYMHWIRSLKSSKDAQEQGKDDPENAYILQNVARMRDNQESYRARLEL